MKNLFLVVVFVSSVYAATAQPGTLDASFGNAGTVTTLLNITCQSNAVALQADGKIVTAGATYFNFTQSFLLVRYNINGTVDSTFGLNGAVVWNTAPDTVTSFSSLLIQPDGKIVAAGSFSTGGANPDFFLARFNADGSSDNSFGNNGRVLLDVANAGYADNVTSITLQPDGKLLVYGSTAFTAVEDLALARFNSNGTLDDVFGAYGVVVTDLAAVAAQPGSVALLSDGHILVNASYQASANDVQDAVLRFNTDGTPDNGFGVNGRVNTGFGAGQNGYTGLAVQPDGKMLLAGSHVNGNFFELGLLRLNADGSLDNGFGTSGVSLHGLTNISFTAYNLALQPDGKILVSGGGSSTAGFFSVTRFNQNGSVDNGFGLNGDAFAYYEQYSTDMSFGIAVQADGKILLAGTDYYNASATQSILARFDGGATSGIASLSKASFNAYPNPTTGNGRVYLVGCATLTGAALYALDGRLIRSYRAPAEQTLSLPSGLPAGEYLLRLFTSGNETSVTITVR